jgi:hypothetical protein
LARVRLSGRLFALALAGLLAPGCHMFRSAEADRTVWNELPSDPRPELWAEGEPRIAVVFEGAYRALGDAPPSFDPNATEYYRRKLRRAGAFTQVLKRDHAEAGGLPVVRMQRSFREDDHTVANLSQALTIPGVLGYRFGLVATLTLELTRPDAPPVVYEARSSLVRIYHYASNHDNARRLVYFEADRANTEAILHQLRAAPALFEAAP